MNTQLRFEDGTNANFWGALPELEDVVYLHQQDHSDFFKEVGQFLKSEGQLKRFGVDLLHSHFAVNADEILIEEHYPEKRAILTKAFNKSAIGDGQSHTPKSWQFAETPAQHETLKVLTWARSADVPNKTIASDDAEIMSRLASIFRKHGMTDKFGMSLLGAEPREGYIWNESTISTDRNLVLEELSLAEYDERNSVKTLFAFNDNGDALLTRGCCEQKVNWGHWRIHPWG